MNSFWRSGAVIAALAGLLTTVVTRYESIISNAFLLWLAIGLGSLVACLAFSWGWTQAFKFFCIDDSADLSAPEPVRASIDAHTSWVLHTLRPRRQVYAVAMATCLMPAFALGAALSLIKLLPDTLTAEIIYWVVWSLGSLLFSAASPWLWKIVFMDLIPWMLAQEKDPYSR